MQVDTASTFSYGKATHSCVFYTSKLFMALGMDWCCEQELQILTPSLLQVSHRTGLGDLEMFQTLLDNALGTVLRKPC